MLSECFVKALMISWIRRPNDDEFTLQMEDEATVSAKQHTWKQKCNVDMPVYLLCVQSVVVIKMSQRAVAGKEYRISKPKNFGAVMRILMWVLGVCCKAKFLQDDITVFVTLYHWCGERESVTLTHDLGVCTAVLLSVIPATGSHLLYPYTLLMYRPLFRKKYSLMNRHLSSADSKFMAILLVFTSVE